MIDDFVNKERRSISFPANLESNIRTDVKDTKTSTESAKKAVVIVEEVVARDLEFKNRFERRIPQLYTSCFMQRIRAT